MQRAGCLFRLKCILFSAETRTGKGRSAFGASFLAARASLGAAPKDLQCFSLLAAFGFWARQPGQDKPSPGPPNSDVLKRQSRHQPLQQRDAQDKPVMLVRSSQLWRLVNGARGIRKTFFRLIGTPN